MIAFSVSSLKPVEFERVPNGGLVQVPDGSGTLGFRATHKGQTVFVRLAGKDTEIAWGAELPGDVVLFSTPEIRVGAKSDFAQCPDDAEQAIGMAALARNGHLGILARLDNARGRYRGGDPSKIPWELCFFDLETLEIAAHVQTTQLFVLPKWALLARAGEESGGEANLYDNYSTARDRPHGLAGFEA